MKFSTTISQRLRNARCRVSAFGVSAFFALAIGASTSVAAAADAATNALQFNVSARIVSLENGKANSDLPPQTIAARVFIKGQNARIETESRSRAVIFIVSPLMLTKLLPESRAGVRWKLDKNWMNAPSTNAPTSSTRLTVQNLFGNPAAIRASLVRGGAKRAGTARLSGTLVDIYKAAKLGGKNQQITAWIRRSDALPLRVQTVSPTLSSVLSWSNYRRVPLSESLFRAPSGYTMRTGSGQPYL